MIPPVILLPKPPPVYSLMNTTVVGLLMMPSQRAMCGHGLHGALRALCMNSLPFCQ